MSNGINICMVHVLYTITAWEAVRRCGGVCVNMTALSRLQRSCRVGHKSHYTEGDFLRCANPHKGCNNRPSDTRYVKHCSNTHTRV